MLKHYSKIINRAINQILGSDYKLVYSVIMDSATQSVQLPSMKNAANPKPANGKDNLSDRFTFDSFVEGDCNKFAKAASLAVSKSPGKTTFNPLVVYGGVS